MCSHDLDGVLLSINPAAVQTLGYRAENGVGRNLKDFLAPSYGKEAFDTYLERIRRNKTDSGVMRLRARDGSERVWLYRNIRHEEPGGRTYVLGHADDITQLKVAEQALKDSEEKFRILFEFAPDAYYLCDLTGCFADGNQAAERLMGFNRDELLGKSFLKVNLLAPADIPKAAKLLALSALGRPTGPDELTLQRKDGRKVRVEIRTFPLKLQGQKLVLGAARDITERQKMEQELRNARDDLEARVAERTAELATLNEQLRQEITERKEATEALRVSEERFNNVFEYSNDGIVIHDLNGRIV